jgi:pilus assembly protein CpaE
VPGTVGIIGSGDRRLEDALREAGVRSVMLPADYLTNSLRGGATPDAFLVDIRTDRSALQSVSAIKRRFPTLGVAIVVNGLEPEVMLEAMRAGVTEVLSEPISAGQVDAALQRILTTRAQAEEGRVIVVIGAKGGIGATTIAVNLADAFAAEKGSALLIDMERGAGDASVLLGAEPRFSVADALENTQRLDEAYFRGLVVRTRRGLDLLAASSRVAGSPGETERLRSLIQFVVRYYPTVVLDVPRGDLALLDALEWASNILIVVNHELPTVRAAHRLAARLRPRYGDRVGLVINRSDKQAEISQDDIAKAVNLPMRFVLPSDYRAALAAVNKGQPIAQLQSNKLGQAVHEFARSLAEGRGPQRTAEGTPESGGLFGWLSPRGK